MDTPITIWLSEDETAAVARLARIYKRTLDEQVTHWIGDDLVEALRLWREDRWIERRKVLETRPDVAAQVDAAGKP